VSTRCASSAQCVKSTADPSTKRSARDAMYGLFPNANLKDRAAWLNENIDKILSEP
jgi:hypothetical protein